MVIGKGMIAKKFSSYENNEKVIIFASGVSNSSEIKEEKFNKEFKLVRSKVKENNDKLFVYFSTCSVCDESAVETKYVMHKITIENYIKSEAKKYIIFRLPQVVGKTENHNTLTNYLFNKIKNGEHFQIWSGSKRNIIDIEDVYFFVHNIIENEKHINSIINITTPFWVNVITIVKIFEDILCAKANYEVVNKGKPYSVDYKFMEVLCENCNFIFTEDYISRLLNKYYGEGSSSAEYETLRGLVV